MKGLFLAASAVLLAGCAPYLAPGPMPVEPYPPHTGGPPAADSCGAAGFQWLVGRPIADVPSQPPGRTWRVYAQGQPVTMDYSPQRMNVEYSQQTQRIVRVWCG